MFTDVSEEPAASIFRAQNVSSMYLQNVEKHLADHAASHPRRWWFT
jgi:hypothetical protein